jgi:hypothetical protein
MNVHECSICSDCCQMQIEEIFVGNRAEEI